MELAPLTPRVLVFTVVGLGLLVGPLVAGISPALAVVAFVVGAAIAAAILAAGYANRPGANRTRGQSRWAGGLGVVGGAIGVAAGEVAGFAFVLVLLGGFVLTLVAAQLLLTPRLQR